MQIFPTQYSTLSATALKDHLEKQYGFDNTVCRLLIRNVSDTYMLEGQGIKYIFKIYRDNYRKLEEIAAEVELLDVLKKGGPGWLIPLRTWGEILYSNFRRRKASAMGCCSILRRGK